jgi:signal transduction histidine kinase
MRGPLPTAGRVAIGLSRIDWAVGVGLALAAELEVATRYGAQVLAPTWVGSSSEPPRILAFTSLASICLVAMAWWRRYPILAMVGLAADGLIIASAGGDQLATSTLPVFFASYALGAHAGWRQLLVGAAIPPLTVAVIDLLTPDYSRDLPGAVVFIAVFMVSAPIAVGRLVRSRSRLVARLRTRTAELQVERQLAAATAQAAERLELMRNLNQVVVRGIETMLDQAAKAEADADGRASASRIEALARELLQEMRRILVELAPPAGTHAPPAGQVGRDLDGDPAPLVGSRLRVRLARVPWELLLAAAFFIALEFDIQARAHPRELWAIDAVGGLAIAAPLAWSRRRPVAAAAASLAAATLFNAWLVPFDSLPTLMTILLAWPFCVAAFSDRRRSLVGLGVCLIGLGTVFGLRVLQGASLGGIVYNAGVVLPMLGFWIAGRFAHDYASLATQLKATNRDLAAERDLRAQRAVLEVRARVARELHDVVGHTLTVIVIQAGAARRLWVSDRPRAEAALRAVAEIARGGLSDLLQSLRALEAGQEVPRRLGDLAAVVETARLAGLRVELEVQGCASAIHPELELAAYRIVQEALTNVLKHAPGADANVRVCCRTQDIELEVLNSLLASNMPTEAGGNGLLSMRERVNKLGGTLEWGPCDGRFHVRALLPLGT